MLPASVGAFLFQSMRCGRVLCETNTSSDRANLDSKAAADWAECSPTGFTAMVARNARWEAPVGGFGPTGVAIAGRDLCIESQSP